MQFKRLIKKTTRDLRKKETTSESLLWAVLRNRKIAGKKFLRQHPLVIEWRKKNRFFVADFYCHEAKLIIELDGSIHEKQKEYDSSRDELLKTSGLNVIRFKNEEVVDNLPFVIEVIKEVLSS